MTEHEQTDRRRSLELIGGSALELMSGLQAMEQALARFNNALAVHPVMPLPRPTRLREWYQLQRTWARVQGEMRIITDLVEGGAR